MITKQHGIQSIEERLNPNEAVQSSVLAYYKMESGVSGLVGVPNSHSVPFRGVLALTDSRLLFYGELTKKTPVFLEINLTSIKKIDEKKIPFALLKSIPGFIVTHDEKDIFTTQGNLDEFANLKSFFEQVKNQINQ